MRAADSHYFQHLQTVLAYIVYNTYIKYKVYKGPAKKLSDFFLYTYMLELYSRHPLLLYAKQHSTVWHRPVKKSQSLLPYFTLFYACLLLNQRVGLSLNKREDHPVTYYIHSSTMKMSNKNASTPTYYQSYSHIVVSPSPEQLACHSMWKLMHTNIHGNGVGFCQYSVELHLLPRRYITGNYVQ